MDARFTHGCQVIHGFLHALMDPVTCSIVKIPPLGMDEGTTRPCKMKSEINPDNNLTGAPKMTYYTGRGILCVAQ